MSDKKLVRYDDNRIIGGVCSGVARYFGFDVGKVRIAWIILTLLATAGFWIYLVLWLVLPLRSE